MDFSNATILCLGDVMLDRYAYCHTERLSPEAPVPVLLLQRWQSMLGGAGNVARNIAALGGNAVLMGLVGQDAAGEEMRALVAGTPGWLTAMSPARGGRPSVRPATWPATSNCFALTRKAPTRSTAVRRPG